MELKETILKLGVCVALAVNAQGCKTKSSSEDIQKEIQQLEKNNNGYRYGWDDTDVKTYVELGRAKNNLENGDDVNSKNVCFCNGETRTALLAVENDSLEANRGIREWKATHKDVDNDELAKRINLIGSYYKIKPTNHHTHVTFTPDTTGAKRAELVRAVKADLEGTLVGGLGQTYEYLNAVAEEIVKSLDEYFFITKTAGDYVRPIGNSFDIAKFAEKLYAEQIMKIKQGENYRAQAIDLHCNGDAVCVKHANDSTFAQYENRLVDELFDARPAYRDFPPEHTQSLKRQLIDDLRPVDLGKEYMVGVQVIKRARVGTEIENRKAEHLARVDKTPVFTDPTAPCATEPKIDTKAEQIDSTTNKLYREYAKKCLKNQQIEASENFFVTQEK